MFRSLFFLIGLANFHLWSQTFAPSAFMPRSTVYSADGCTGLNRSPDLRWRAEPPQTKSFALIVHDPDAPVPGGWYHWVVFNVPRGTHHFAAGTLAGMQGTSSFKTRSYGGPCPPPGRPHHYNFTLYALDVATISPPRSNPDGPALLRAMRGHIVATARVTGLYER